MPIDTLPPVPETALVLIDLQNGVTALPTIHPADEIVARAARLAETFRSLGGPVVRVRVAFSPDGADSVRVPVDENSVRTILPRLARLADSEAIIAALSA
jgi:nicotinamidase-related amidase